MITNREEQDGAATDISSDRLDGAEAIAAYLGKTSAWVYQARRAGWSVPIRKRDGLGVYAFRSELDAWARSPDTLPIKKSA